MSVSGPQGSFPHFEHSAPSILWMMKNSPYATVTSPFYPPFYYKNVVTRGSGAKEENESDVRFGNLYHSSFDQQKGAGLGGIFRNTIKFLKPVVHRGLKTLASEGLRAGSQVLDDWRAKNDNEFDAGPLNLKDITRKRLAEAKDRIKGKIPNILLGDGKKSNMKGGRKLKKRSKVELAVLGRGRMFGPSCGNGRCLKKGKGKGKGKGRRGVQNLTAFRVPCPAKSKKGGGKKAISKGGGKKKVHSTKRSKATSGVRRGYSPVDIFSSSI